MLTQFFVMNVFALKDAAQVMFMINKLTSKYKAFLH
jgi:hypothetical protein